MGRGIDIPWVEDRYTMGRGRYIMGRRVDIPWIWGLICHVYGGQYTLGRGVDIPWVWGSKYHG